MLKITILALALLAFGAVAIGQTRTERDVLTANEAFDRAIVLRDAAGYDRILADDFIFTNFEGVVTNKLQEIARVKAGGVTFESGKSDDLRVKIYGNTAVVTGRFVAKGKNSGREFTFVERYTAVFVKRNGRWQMVAEHASEVKQK